MRILHVITTIELGGAEKQLLILVEKQIQKGHFVAVLFLKGQPTLKKDFESIGATTISNIANTFFGYQVYMLGKRIMPDFDLVHSHLPRSEIAVWLTRSGKPWVTSRHNAESFMPKSNRHFSTFLSKMVTRRTNAIIAISGAVKDYLERQGELNTNASLYIVPYGYSDREVYLPKKRNVYQKTGVISVVTISRLAPQKDLVTLIRATKEVQRLGFRIETKIYGEGPELIDLMVLVTKLDLRNAILFCGKSNDVPRILNENDIFVLTSKYEGFGLVLLEAMQARLPIVCCKNSATAEVLGETYEGLVPIGDYESIASKILRFSDPEIGKDISSYLDTRLGIYDPHLMCDRTLDVYSNALEDFK